MDSARNTRLLRRRLQRSTGRALVVRTAAVALFDAMGVYALVSFAGNGTLSVAALMAFALALVNWAYLSPRTQGARWLTPGLVLMAFFVVYPVLYTSYVSLTNWQTGNILTKDQAIEQLEQRRVRTGESGESGDLIVYRNGADDLVLLVVGETVEAFAGVPRSSDDEPGAATAAFAVPADFEPEAPPEEIEGYELLSGLGVTAVAGRLQDLELDLPDGRSVVVETLTSFRVTTGGKRFAYDPATDTMFDAQQGRRCAAGTGTFYCDDVPETDVARIAIIAKDSTIRCSGGICDRVPLFALDPSLTGWRDLIGFDNYIDLAQEERIRSPFLRVLIWNIAFAVGSVLLTFAVGLGLAMLMQREEMRFRGFYRSIFIIPYAVPGFLSILVWRGLLSTEFGKVNELLNAFGLPDVAWLSGNYQAMAAVLLVNTWLGFPYMFLISSGALTSIPTELIEAARVDGAGPFRRFREVVLPLLLVSTAPLLIGAFAFNFNNFLLIFLLTGGGPPLAGYDVPVGSTDLLISFTFGLAQSSGRGQQFGLASAIIVVIFLVLAITSALSFRLTKKLEEIYDR
ncbi:MAG: ABC transporter permease subunit [Acidimicrobiaceae bacterium]|nr:ABC transporter permease subunit [Acidimicrobiaceae bacterium]